MSCRVLLILSALLLALLATGASGHGTVDQTLTGDPDCTPQALRGSQSSSREIQQEFIPGWSTVAGVDLCLAGDSRYPDTPVTVNVRSGTVASPGPILASGAAVLQPGVQWVHVDIALAVTAGETYLLEIPQSWTFNWKGTCGEIGGPCTSLDPDLYPQGISSWEGMDFGFRTYAGPGPEPFANRWGDVDCNGGAPESVDALKTLRHVAALSVSQQEPCPNIGVQVDVQEASPHPWGDGDCDGDVDTVDALKTLRFVAALPVTQNELCPDIGQDVTVQE